MNTPQIGIHVHGRHVDTEDGEQIMLGNPLTGQLGQLTKMLQIYLERPVTRITMGTGASNKDGLTEAEYWWRFFLENIRICYDFPEFEGVSHTAILGRLERVMHLDTTSKNTGEELTNAIMHHAAKGTNRLILVTAPTHMPRCTAIAGQLLYGQPLTNFRISYEASDVGYAGSTPGDVAVIEPPHRGDDPDLFITKSDTPYHKLVKRYYQIPADGRRAFREDLVSLMDQYTQQDK